MELKWSRRGAKTSQGAPEGAQMEPKREPRGNQNEPWTPTWSPCAWGSIFEPKMDLRGRAFGSHLGSQNHLKRELKINLKSSTKNEENETLKLRKGAKMRPKCSPKHDKNRSQNGTENILKHTCFPMYFWGHFDGLEPNSARYCRLRMHFRCFVKVQKNNLKWEPKYS